MGGFQGRSLEIPEGTDPEAAAIITACFRSDPAERTDFGTVLDQLRSLRTSIDERSRAGSNGTQSVNNSPTVRNSPEGRYDACRGTRTAAEIAGPGDADGLSGMASSKCDAKKE